MNFKPTFEITQNKSVLAFCLGASLALSPAHSNEFENELNAFCEKTKACAIAEMERSMPPELREMAMGMISGVCVGITQSYQSVLQSKYSELVDAATSCMKSMNKLSCEQLEESSETSECKEFERLSEKYSE